MVKDAAHQNEAGGREKRLVAFSSVLAAVFLSLTKLVIGLLTGSLGIIAEAAHSGLDLVAAGVTYFSVHVSDRPPDESHAYGHGKIENLSALIETLLLFITCAWIVYEAVRRLLFLTPPEIEVTFWSFGIMALSIIINVTRSRALMKTARKYNSQALEADAIHFSTDVWSSAVVIFGLAAVFASQQMASRFPLLAIWLGRADALAAIGVAAIILFVSYRLGSRTISILLDSTPKGVTRQITELVGKVPGVSAVQRIRVRQGGAVTFVDMTLEVTRSKSLEEADEIATKAEQAVRDMIPRCDVIVHVEPVGDNKTFMERVRSIAARRGFNIHDVYTNDINGRPNLEVHVEVPENLTLSQAHQQVSVLEDTLLKEFPELVEVVVHIDPVGDASRHLSSNLSILSGVHDKITKIVKQVKGVQNCHSVTVLRERSHLVTSFHCTMSPDFPVTGAHELSVQIEDSLRRSLPSLERITIHLEPCDETCRSCDTACDYKRTAS